MQFLNGFLCILASENQTPNCEKILNYIGKIVFVASRLVSHKIASACDFYTNLAQLGFILAPKTYQNRVLEPSWGVLGASWRPLGASWAHLGASWWRLGASGARLEASWARFDLNYVKRGPGSQLRLATGNQQ